MLGHNDDELDSETDEEEEVELQQRNVDLEMISYRASYSTEFWVT